MLPAGSSPIDPGAEADRLALGATRGGILAASAICLSTLALGLLGLLGQPAMLALTAGLFGLGLWASRGAPKVAARRLLSWPVLFGVPLVLLETLLVLPLPPVDWDAMTYHLYLPARWLQAGSLIHVPTPFGDENPAFAPQNGALIYTWWMGLVQSDAGVAALQVAALFLLAAALWVLARQLGASPAAAGLALAALPWLAPVQRWTFSGNVDVFMTAFWAAAAALTLAGRQRRDAFAGGLALGLAIGTKTVALPLGLGLVLAATPRLLRWPRRDLLIFTGGTLLTGSFWWLRNFYLYGNPIFPLDIALGSWRPLPGVFGAAAMRESVLHIESATQWLASLQAQWGIGTCILVLCGWAALAAAPVKAEVREQRRLPAALLLLALGWTVFVFEVVPFNNQSRFLLPALALAVPGWSLLLERIPRPGVRVLACALGLLALAATSRPDLFLLDRLALLSSSADPRLAALAGADYSLWRDGYLPFNHPDLPPKRIAYSGGNVPYTLIGPGLRNQVVYCNVQGRPEDGLYDFWLRNGKARYDTYMPGIVRGQEDADTWLACLEKERIEAVVLFWMLPVNLPPGWQADEGFPVERRFMRERPGLFRPVVQTGRAEIWSVKPWTDAPASGPEKQAER